MKKFNPIEYNRERWGDRFHTKNRPKQCREAHQFCHLDYEWVNEDECANTPINEVPLPSFRTFSVSTFRKQLSPAQSTTRWWPKKIWTIGSRSPSIAVSLAWSTLRRNSSYLYLYRHSAQLRRRNQIEISQKDILEEIRRRDVLQAWAQAQKSCELS